MQAPNSASTLELVVNEQQMHNMSQVDLSGAPTNSQHRTSSNPQQDGQTSAGRTGLGAALGFSELKQWPARFCEAFNEKLDEAKAKSETKTEFLVEVVQSFSGIIVWILCFIFTIFVPVILFLIGLANLDACNDLPSIPYLVFAMGFVMTASNLFNLAFAMDLHILTNHSQLSIDIKNTIASILNIIFNCVVAFLYILTAYKILVSAARSKQEGQPPSAGNENNETSQFDCNPTLLGFTYWFITVTLGLIITLSILGTILYIYTRYRLAIIRGSTPRSQTRQTNGAPSNQLSTNP